MYVILCDSGRLHMRKNVLIVNAMEARKKNHSVVVASEANQNCLKDWNSFPILATFGTNKASLRHGIVTTYITLLTSIRTVSFVSKYIKNFYAKVQSIPLYFSGYAHVCDSKPQVIKNK